MFCPNCGKQNDDNNAFCGWCGSSLKEYHVFINTNNGAEISSQLNEEINRGDQDPTCNNDANNVDSKAKIVVENTYHTPLGYVDPPRKSNSYKWIIAVVLLVVAATGVWIYMSRNAGYQSPLLKALNIKGRAKIVCYDEGNLFGFNFDGSVPGYIEGSDVELIDNQGNEVSSFRLFIKDNRLEAIKLQPMMAHWGYKLKVTNYDDKNRPVKADIYDYEDICRITDVKISYPESDEKGNWLTMQLDYDKVDDFLAPTEITRTIEYWPDDATADDSFPEIPTESFISELIMKADNQERSLWSMQLRNLYDNARKKASMSGNLLDLRFQQNMVDVEIESVRPSVDCSELYVVFKCRLHDGACYRSENLDMIAKIIYEANEWKIDDIGYNACATTGSAGHYFPQDGWLSEILSYITSK